MIVVIASMATLNAHPNDYAGALLIEGTLHDTNATVRAINANFCSAFDAMLAGGVVYDGQSGPAVKALNQLSQVAPHAPVVFPGFPASQPSKRHGPQLQLAFIATKGHKSRPQKAQRQQIVLVLFVV